MEAPGVCVARRLQFGKIVTYVRRRNNVRARFGQRFGHGAPEAAPAAGDDDNAPVE